ISDSAPKPAFETDGDLLEYLLNLGSIDRKDGLLVTWYHSANKKSELAAALKSKIYFFHLAGTISLELLVKLLAAL
uniref:Uncharacterized protein n=1 Tax=Chelonoidis abingdonii TaxID=106734 RepID=A0A8C0HJL8_CHEAB